MNKRAMILSGITVLLINVAIARAETDREDATADKVRYQGLLRDIKSVESDYYKTQNQAFIEAKRDGQASLATKSRLLSLSDKRRRIMDRLLLLSLRHGWEMPDPEMPASPGTPEISNEKERVFAPADEIIKKKFAQEARHIAEKVRLPVISLPMPNPQKQVASGGDKWPLY